MKYQLKLFIAGDTELSRAAVSNLQQVCCEFLNGNCETEIVDILETPRQAGQFRVIATPVVVRTDVTPHLKVLGNLSNRERLVSALNLRPAATESFSESPPRTD